ncbi:hypothetical protein ABT115_14590 [Streptomyces sp. NPDC001832]|uniref:hypothetical protein n=1 Tax=Streptomyces sp. NPDC001832 TaxID=3154527 RepID=UPI00331D335C
MTLQEEGGPALTCGTIGQAEQKDAQDQFNKGFQDGFTSGKKLCGMALQQGLQGLVPLDPNYQKGFTAGSNAAIAQFC